MNPHFVRPISQTPRYDAASSSVSLKIQTHIYRFMYVCGIRNPVYQPVLHIHLYMEHCIPCGSRSRLSNPFANARGFTRESRGTWTWHEPPFFKPLSFATQNPPRAPCSFLPLLFSFLTTLFFFHSLTLSPSTSPLGYINIYICISVRVSNERTQPSRNYESNCEEHAFLLANDMIHTHTFGRATSLFPNEDSGRWAGPAREKENGNKFGRKAATFAAEVGPNPPFIGSPLLCL